MNRVSNRALNGYANADLGKFGDRVLMAAELRSARKVLAKVAIALPYFAVDATAGQIELDRATEAHQAQFPEEGS